MAFGELTQIEQFEKGQARPARGNRVSKGAFLR